MPSPFAARWASRTVVIALLVHPLRLAAQTAHEHGRDSTPEAAMTSPAVPGGSGHMQFTAARPGTSADTARALAMVRRLREAIAPYQDVKAAEAAGYRMRPDMEMRSRKALIHMGNPRLRGDPNAAFDPSRPQALLYRQPSNGELTLAGVMFTAPVSASLEELDARVPLSVAQWHKHVNVCMPQRGARKSRELRRADTPEACAKAGGRFRGESARYMVHVMTDAGDDVALIFPQGKEHHHHSAAAPR